MSDPTLSDIDFKNKMDWLWTTLKNDSPAARIDLLKKSCSEQSSWNISRNFDWPIISFALSSTVVTIERDWSIRRSIMNLIGRRSVLFWIPGSPSDLSTAHRLFNFLSPIQMLYNLNYSLIIKSWIPIQKIYENFSFPGHEPDHITGKLIHQKIMSTFRYLSPNPTLMYNAYVKDSENAGRWLAALSSSIVH